ncbi:hypothetical protein GCM10023149_23060 [Mucilaginibacter gynuensis]|uniref:Uncharacterized protein n=1 Tax=Mucilaginibacter gynuensis TaxID=1302236 RepID=A0ABP8GDZ5_9SPHI
MSGFPILDLVVGIIFIYFLLSIICSSMVEILITVGKYRAKMLEKWLLTIFDKEITTSSGKKELLGQAIMDHCSTTALSSKGSSNSYMDARNFTEALLEKVTFDEKNPKSIAHDLTNIVTSIENSDALPTELRRVLLSYASEAKANYAAISTKTASEIDLFKSKVETWYDTNMQRVSGSLKTRLARPFTFWTSVVVVLFLNADTVSITQYLYSNPTARAHVAGQAYAAAKDTALIKQVQNLKTAHATNDTTAQTMQQITDTLSARVKTLRSAEAALDDAIPLGWNNRIFKNSQGVFCWWLIPTKVAGLAATILAIMMGAPFWFELLNKVANLRGNGNKPEPKKEA